MYKENLNSYIILNNLNKTQIYIVLQAIEAGMRAKATSQVPPIPPRKPNQSGIGAPLASTSSKLANVAKSHSEVDNSVDTDDSMSDEADDLLMQQCIRIGMGQKDLNGIPISLGSHMADVVNPNR